MTAQAGGGSGRDFHIDIQGVITSVQGIDDVNAEIKAAFKQLKTEGENVITGSWTGSAASKLNEGWQEWQDGVAKIIGALDQVNQVVASAARTFHRADQGE